jgi:nitroimidazol reductase NimA-like FMN-containing flavoprotein (pyridoxamine 5'-phosphate oxidase superfamily)
MSTQTLAREECLGLIALASVGRVALSANALPTVVPVNFRLVDDHIVFHTGRGAPKNVIAFQVDDIDPKTHVGWSVVVTGVAHEVTDPAELEAMQTVLPSRWVNGDGALVSLSLDLMTGCRLEAS